VSDAEEVLEAKRHQFELAEVVSDSAGNGQRRTDESQVAELERKGRSAGAGDRFFAALLADPKRRIELPGTARSALMEKIALALIRNLPTSPNRTKEAAMAN
jgi:hypothetical protein